MVKSNAQTLVGQKQLITMLVENRLKWSEGLLTLATIHMAWRAVRRRWITAIVIYVGLTIAILLQLLDSGSRWLTLLVLVWNLGTRLIVNWVADRRKDVRASSWGIGCCWSLSLSIRNSRGSWTIGFLALLLFFLLTSLPLLSDLLEFCKQEMLACQCYTTYSQEMVDPC